jgi:hypothetical protein
LPVAGPARILLDHADDGVPVACARERVVSGQNALRRLGVRGLLPEARVAVRRGADGDHRGEQRGGRDSAGVAKASHPALRVEDPAR